MNVQCSQCQSAYDIPDERLPFGKEISFPCPSCQTMIDLDLTGATPDDPDPPAEEAAANDSQTVDESQTQHPNYPKGDELKTKIFKHLKNLPPIPHIILKAREAMTDPKKGFKELSQAIESDQAIATLVLKLANSAYYGMAGKVGSIRRASVVLGFKTISELIMVAGANSMLNKHLEGYDLDPGFMFEHSLAVAFASRAIAKMKNPDVESDAFAAGLIHDVGKLVLDTHIVERKDLVESILQANKNDFLRAEKQVLGFDHAQMAAWICERWNFPKNLTLAIRYHHQPERASVGKFAHILHLADDLAHWNCQAHEEDETIQVDCRSTKALGLKYAQIEAVMTHMQTAVREINLINCN